MSGKKHKKPKPKLSPPLAYDEAYDELIVNWAARTVTYQGRTIVCSPDSTAFSMPVLAVGQ